MAEHNTAFSEGLITGILIDFVKCVREQVLMGNTVKIPDLAIFKATVEANALETVYDAVNDKTATAAIGTLPAGAKTGAAVKTIKLLAQSTGEFTRDELKKDVKLSWTDKTKAQIAAVKGGNAGSVENQSGNGDGSSENTNPTNGDGQNGGGTGSLIPVGGDDNGGGNTGDNTGGDNGGGNGGGSNGGGDEYN
jgi:hypothetical protein